MRDIRDGGFIAEVQLLSKLAEAIDEPSAGLAVSLVALSRGIGPDQCIGQATRMKHGAPSTGPSHNRQSTCSSKCIPMLGVLPLMATDGKPGAIPAIKAQHRIGLGLLQKQGINGHLGGAIRCEQW
tara:strand:+ start:942 stop:1319 length:378 start_codon:yes stop_codon:yes gene_type:complete